MDLQTNQTGLIPHFLDALVELEAQNTPAFSMIRKGEPPTNPIMQKAVDSPGFVSRRGLRNKTPAGAAKDQSKGYAIVESCNQWIREPISIGKKDMKTANRAGVGFKQLFARESTKAIKALKTAVDSVILDDCDQRMESANLGSETRGLFSWASPTAQACKPVPEDYLATTGQRYTGTLSDCGPDTIAALLDERWSVVKASEKLLCFCGNLFKSHVSKWSMYLPDSADCSTVRRFENSTKEERVLRRAIDLLEFDTGKLELHLEPNLLGDRDATAHTPMSDKAKRSFIAFPHEAVSLHFAEDPVLEMLPEDGGSKNAQVSTIFHVMAEPWKMVSGIIAA